MLEWLANNIDFIFEVIGIIGLLCTGIVEMFSNKPWAKWLVKICDCCSFVNTKENKEIIKKALEKKKK